MDETFGAYVLGNCEPWEPVLIVIGTHEDAAAKCFELSCSYIGPIPFVAAYDPSPREGSAQ